MLQNVVPGVLGEVGTKNCNEYTVFWVVKGALVSEESI